MTKATGIGRGGARPGSGRKAVPVKKVRKRPTQAEKVVAVMVEEAKASPQAAARLQMQADVTAAAQRAAMKGIKRLAKIAEHGTEIGAIKATKELLTWGFVTPAIAKAAAAADRYKPGSGDAVVQLPREPKDEKPPELGKKEVRKENAERATADGTYAVPQPPRLAVDNSRG